MGILYVVATPIGNLADITLRALEVLKSVDRVYCEDTRVTRKLFTRYGIQTPLRSFFAGNEAGRVGEILEHLRAGESVALVSDAGTPGVSDPGYLLVRAARREQIPVVPVPGPSALTAALSVAGLPTQRVLFLGFPPRRKGERETLLRSLQEDPATLVFYEAPHRVKAFLEEAERLLPGRERVVARELTKRFESVIAGEGEIPDRGEFVVLYGPPPERAARPASREELEEAVAEAAAGGLSRSEALKRAGARFGLSRREAYALLVGKDGEDRSRGL